MSEISWGVSRKSPYPRSGGDDKCDDSAGGKLSGGDSHFREMMVRKEQWPDHEGSLKAFLKYVF